MTFLAKSAPSYFDIFMWIASSPGAFLFFSFFIVYPLFAVYLVNLNGSINRFVPVSKHTPYFLLPIEYVMLEFFGVLLTVLYFSSRICLFTCFLYVYTLHIYPESYFRKTVRFFSSICVIFPVYHGFVFFAGSV